MVLTPKECRHPIIVPSISQAHGDNLVPYFQIEVLVKPFVRLTRYNDDEDLLLGIIAPKPNMPSVKVSFAAECSEVLEGDTYSN